MEDFTEFLLPFFTVLHSVSLIFRRILLRLFKVTWSATNETLCLSQNYAVNKILILDYTPYHFSFTPLRNSATKI